MDKQIEPSHATRAGDENPVPTEARESPREETVEGLPDPAHRTPRWVKLWGLVALVAVVALIVVLVAGVEHGPGRHSGAGHPQPSSQTSVAVQYAPAPGSAGGGQIPPAESDQ